VQLGQELKAGERIGHPSCAGGPSTGSHLHLARRYNGEWIPADQDIPFNISGWISRGDGLEYDGTLTKGAIEIEASGYPTDENKISQ
jgi:murein DD-endopeptidase MepM/ murein hydrolase activator NlpD